MTASEAADLGVRRTAGAHPGVPPDAVGVEEVADLGRRLAAAVGTAVTGKQGVIEDALCVFLAGGHLLLQDVPGVGKTTLAKALARTVGLPVQRIQFTPDLLPSDITGMSVFDQEHRRFEFRPGAVFANVVVCDEINRASPKTQSAVLEAMEEHQVTVDGQTYALPEPFFVVATQNPIEMEGTYPLPEAQRDRFMARLSIGYPDAAAETAMLAGRELGDPHDSVPTVADGDTVTRAREVVAHVHAGEALLRYVVDLVAASRSTPMLRLGASPRAGLHLLRAARARAALLGRPHVLPEDVQALARPVLAHRLLPSQEARMAGTTVTDVVDGLVESVPVPGRLRA